MGLTDIYNVVADVQEKATITSDLLTEEERLQATGTPHRTTTLERGHVNEPQSLRTISQPNFFFAGGVLNIESWELELRL